LVEPARVISGVPKINRRPPEERDSRGTLLQLNNGWHASDRDDFLVDFVGYWHLRRPPVAPTEGLLTGAVLK
jgi:hypothetical protein